MRPIALVWIPLAFTLSACKTPASVPDPAQPDPAEQASVPDDGADSASPTAPPADTEANTESTSDGGSLLATPPAEDAPPKADPSTQGPACNTNDDCAAGQMCEGEGCGDMEGQCMPANRPCTRDLRAYCGCDGQTFRSSGSCPGARFSRRGPCEAEG